MDFKTDAAGGGEAFQPPAKAYLAQLGAYAAGIGPAWPGHEIRLAVLWTAAPSLQMIDQQAAHEAYRTGIFARYAGS